MRTDPRTTARPPSASVSSPLDPVLLGLQTENSPVGSAAGNGSPGGARDVGYVPESGFRKEVGNRPPDAAAGPWLVPGWSPMTRSATTNNAADRPRSRRP